jgi:hypothetical protein
MSLVTLGALAPTVSAQEGKEEYETTRFWPKN